MAVGGTARIHRNYIIKCAFSNRNRGGKAREYALNNDTWLIIDHVKILAT